MRTFLRMALSKYSIVFAIFSQKKSEGAWGIYPPTSRVSSYEVASIPIASQTSETM